MGDISLKEGDDCPHCETEEAWTTFEDDYRRHAGGVLCHWQPFRLATRRIGISNQYGSHYILGRGPKPACGEGLRFRNWTGEGNYHAILIHLEDVPTFVQRVKQFRIESGQV